MFKGRDDWFDIWAIDKDCMLDTMVRNMASDLACGYDYFGNCIKRQREEIDIYRNEYCEQLEKFKEMEEKVVNRWCYYDMLKRGVISVG